MRYNPFNILRHKSWDRAPKEPMTIAAALLGAGASTVAVYALAFVIGMGISFVTSWALSALSGKPSGGLDNRGLLTNIKNPAAPRDYVYGETRKGGIVTYLESTGEDNKFLHIIVSMAAHEVESITDFYINDEKLVADPITATVYNITLVGSRKVGPQGEGEFEVYNSVYSFAVPVALDFPVGTITYTQYRQIFDQSYSKTLISGQEFDGTVFTSITITDKGTDTGFVADDKWKGKVRIEAFTGNQTAAPSTLLAESTLLTGVEGAKFIGYGIAYMYIRLEYDVDVFPNGIPVFTAMVKGKKVYDPRTGLTGYSANSALCIRDYIVSEYGLDDAGFVDDTIFAAAANVCDESVALAAGGTQPRYEINGVVSSAANPGDILQAMTTSCAGTLFWGQGKWQLKPGYYTVPTKTLTLDDLRGPITLSTRNSRRDNFNVVRGTFNNSEARYVQEDYPEIKGTAFIAEDNGYENALDLALPLTTNSFMAQRLAKLTLFRGREQMTLSADFGMNAFDVQVGDIISFTNERYGWTEKEFEVLAWNFHPSGEGGDLVVSLILQETSSAAFDWNAEESAIIGNNTTVPIEGVGLTINSLIAYSVVRIQGDGTSINTAVVSWARPSSSFVDSFEVEWKVTTDEVYSSTTTRTLSIELSPIIDSTEYTFRVRAVSVSGVRGEWASVTLIPTGDLIAPSDPTNLSAVGDLSVINLTWLNPPDLDFKETEIWEGATATLGSAVKIASAAGSSYNRGNLAPLTLLYYWIRAVDYTGNTSNFVGPVSGLTRQITTADIAPAVIPWDAMDPTGDAVIASAIDTLRAEVAGDYATITTTNLIENDVSVVEGRVTSLRAKYGITIDLNGNITGFQLLSGVGGSAFNVRADQFAVFNSTGTAGDTPFTIFTSPRTVNGITFPAGTYVKNAYIDYTSIVTASIDTLQIKGNAVTVPLAITSNILQSGNGTSTEVQFVNLTLASAGHVLVTWSGAQGYLAAGPAHAIRLYVGGVLMMTRGGTAINDMPNLSWAGSLGAGTHRVSIYWEGTNSNIILSNGTLSAFGAKR